MHKHSWLWQGARCGKGRGAARSRVQPDRMGKVTCSCRLRCSVDAKAVAARSPRLLSCRSSVCRGALAVASHAAMLQPPASLMAFRARPRYRRLPAQPGLRSACTRALTPAQPKLLECNSSSCSAGRKRSSARRRWSCGSRPSLQSSASWSVVGSSGEAATIMGRGSALAKKKKRLDPKTTHTIPSRLSLHKMAPRHSFYARN